MILAELEAVLETRLKTGESDDEIVHCVSLKNINSFLKYTLAPALAHQAALTCQPFLNWQLQEMGFLKIALQ